MQETVAYGIRVDTRAHSSGRGSVVRSRKIAVLHAQAAISRRLVSLARLLAKRPTTLAFEGKVHRLKRLWADIKVTHTHPVLPAKLRSLALCRVVGGMWMIGAVLALSAVSIANKFPLLFPDTGFFLITSLEFDIPWNRPIFYGLFIAQIHRIFGLLGIIFVQSALMVAIVHIFLKTFAKRGPLFTFLGSGLITSS